MYDPTEGIFRPALSPDLSLAASLVDPKTIRVAEVASGTERKRLQHDDKVNAVVFSPDGSLLATASNDATARIWDIRRNSEPLKFFHNDWVTTLAFSHHAKTLATGSWNETSIRVPTGHSDLVSEAVWRDATTAVVNIWRTRNIEMKIHSAIQKNHDGEIIVHNPNYVREDITAVAFSPDDATLATCSWAVGTGFVDTGPTHHLIRFWNLSKTDPELINCFDFFDWETRNQIVFCANGSQMAVSNRDQVAVVDPSTGAELLNLRCDSSVNAIASAPKRSLVAAGSACGAVTIWNNRNGEKLLVLRHDKAVEAILFSDDENQVGLIDGENRPRVFDLTTDLALA